MVYFLNSKVKTHTGKVLQSLFNENQEKIVILAYSMVSRRSPLVSIQKRSSYYPGYFELNSRTLAILESFLFIFEINFFFRKTFFYQ